MQTLVSTFLFLFVTVAPTAYAIEVGSVPEKVTLSDEEGGKLDGNPWSSDEFKGKVFILFYVDPDEKDLNNAFAEALKKEEFPLEKFRSVAIINMDATWAPNFAIESGLKKKQEEHPRALYVKDMKKKLVKTWKLGDDTSVVVLFDKDGTVLFHKDGKLSDKEAKQVVDTIKSKL